MDNPKLVTRNDSERCPFVFLSDQPIAADEQQEIRFGHVSIVETLRNIVLSCPTPFTIGFIGKWGTGKTTILDLLKARLITSDIGVVKFDIWKHEGDSLRRTFLKDIVDQLKEEERLPQDFEYNERLDKNVSITSEGKYIFRWTRIGLILAAIVLLAIIGFIIWMSSKENFETYIKIIGSVLTGGLITSIVVILLQRTVTTEKVTATTDRYKDPYQFESEFKKIIESLKSNDKKLVVIVDNLDRTQHEKAVELLSTIKTYLDLKRCVFLIACDAEAIKKHLECVYNPHNRLEGDKQVFDSDEFLRKFFNTYIKIPDFIDTELQTYTEDLLKETKAVQLDSPDVAQVITCAFRDNPRQIKQFINSLLAHYLVALTRENDMQPSIAPKGSITNNMPFLAKSLIVQQKFPEQYSRFLQGETKVNDSEAFNDFMIATKRISTEDIRPFHYLKLSEEELHISGIKELEIALLDNKIELVKVMLSKLADDPDKIAYFNKYLSGLLGRYKKKIPVLFNVISSALVATRDTSLMLDKQLYDQIAGLLSDNTGVGKELLHFDCKLIFNQVLERCNSSDRDGILALYLGILNAEIKSFDSDDYIKSLITELIDHKLWLGDKKPVVVKAITDKYSTYEALSLFVGRPKEDQKEFISTQAMAKYISSLGDTDVDTSKIGDKVELITTLEDSVDKDVLNDIVVKLKDLVNAERVKPYRKEKEALLACVYDVLETFYDEVVKLGTEGIGQLADVLIQGMDAVGSWGQKKIFMPPCLILSDALEGQRKSIVDSHIKVFITSAEDENLHLVFQQVDDKEWLINGREDAFQQAVMKSQETFNLVYPEADATLRTQWLQLLIDSYPQRAIAFLEQQKYKVDDAKSIVSKILAKVGQSAIAEKNGFYSACNAMRCADDESLKGQFASQITSLLVNSNADIQQVGMNALKDAGYFTATQKRDIARAVIEWLRGLNPSSAYQPHAVNSVVINWQELQEPPKKDFLDFVFTKLIRQGTNTSSIQLGFEKLAGITPRPEYNDDNKGYFDDILSRAGTESNTQIKVVLSEGLLSLRPKNPNRFSKEFWRQVTELQSKS